MVAQVPEDYPFFCSICGKSSDGGAHPTYANPVCDDCDSRAVSEPGVPAQQGDNPVFIDGIQCYRRYKMEGWLSQRDAFGCEDYDEFYDKHYDDYGPIHTYNQPNPPKENRSIRQLSGFESTSVDDIVARSLEGDILDTEADALICGITTDPSLDGGVAGAVCDATDIALRPLVLDKAPLQLGDVVVTGGYDLPYSYLVFVAATPAEPGQNATKECMSESVKNGLRKVADLRLPTVSLPLIGAGAGGLDATQSATAIVSGIRASAVSPPVCVRLVGRTSSDRQAIEDKLPANASIPTTEHQSDPLEGVVQTRFEQVDKPGGEEEWNVSDWEVYTWIRFDPFTGEIVAYDDRKSSTQMTLQDMGPPEQAEEMIEHTLTTVGKDQIRPEQWLAHYESFNSQLGGIRAAIEHPQLDRPLYVHEQALVGMLRGLEHPDSEYDEILELILEIPARSSVEENVARLRYQLSEQRADSKEDLEAGWLQTARCVIDHTVETLSHLDFDHEMSDMLAVEPVDRIEIVAYSYSRVAFELSVPMDIAEDVYYSDAYPEVLLDATT